MKRHCRFNDEFYQIYQTTPNRLAPDRVWVVPGEGIHDLPKTNFSPPLLLGDGDGCAIYYTMKCLPSWHLSLILLRRPWP